MIYRDQKTKNISFPLGGIGTGCVGLAGNGALIDWEIFNRPQKNTYNGYSHFAIKVTRDGKSVAKVLQGDTNESLMGMHDGKGVHIGFGYGPHVNSMAGYPHFKDVTFDGAFPIAGIQFAEKNFPVAVQLTAFNPFIPHDADNSGLPAAFFEWEIENLTQDELEVALAFSVQNPAEKSMNEEMSEDGLEGLFLKNTGAANNDIGYHDLCVVTDEADVVKQAFWYRGAWQDSSTMFWKNLTAASRMQPRTYETPGRRDHGTLTAYEKIAPAAKKKIRMVLAWNVPNQYNYWSPMKDADGKDITWKNHYATRFENAKATAKYAMKHFDEFYEKTKLFARALHGSTLSPPVIDAISANLSVLKTPTVFRLEDGSLWGWEGNSEDIGSCEGSCQHVWNYAYAVPFLFPELERSLRENTMKYALTESGATKFRVPLPVGRELGNFRSCVDGQMGEIIKCYREWKISGDDLWLQTHAQDIFAMLEFAWSEKNIDKWDADKDGVMEGRQHHTLDMELFGPSSWLQGFYLLALDCAKQIAQAIGDHARAKEYGALYEKGKLWTNNNLFNGKYFCQKVDLEDKSVTEIFEAPRYWNEEARELKYQIAEGCIIDQMLADWHAAIIGNKGVFDAEKKHVALENLYRNNYKASMREVTNMWRNFALNDEVGTVICSYPEGAKMPAIPIPYCEECMTGFEYALAGLMVVNGFVSEGETMVKAIRDRYDGEKRNPWNEIECGSNYARSMASYALLPIYSGFSFDMTQKYMGFSPVGGDGGRYLWSVGNTWGTVEIDKKKQTLLVLGAPLSLKSYGLMSDDRVLSVFVDGQEIPFEKEQGRLILGEVVITQSMEIILANGTL